MTASLLRWVLSYYLLLGGSRESLSGGFHSIHSGGQKLRNCREIFDRHSCRLGAFAGLHPKRNHPIFRTKSLSNHLGSRKVILFCNLRNTLGCSILQNLDSFTKLAERKDLRSRTLTLIDHERNHHLSAIIGLHREALFNQMNRILGGLARKDVAHFFLSLSDLVCCRRFLPAPTI
jgi:hypothetical protein